MAKLVLIALAATAVAAPLGAQTVSDPGPGYGPPPVHMNAPPPGRMGPPPGVSWREQAPPPQMQRMPMGNYGGPQAPGAPQVRTRTWSQDAPPPPPGMMHGDGDHGGMGMMHRDGDHQGMQMHGYGHPGERRHIEVRRFHGRGPGMGWGGTWGGNYGEGWGGGGYVEGAPLPPPPCGGPCAPPPPMPYGGYGYSYGGGGTVMVTETTVTEAAPVVERRTYYTTVRERIRVVRRHHVVRHCRCKLVKARPRAGERG